MKTSPKFIAIICLLLSASAMAKDEEAKSQRLTMDYVIKTYIDALSHGNLKPLNEVLDPYARFSTTQGEKTTSYTKAQMLEMLKRQENVEQNCSSDYAIVDQKASEAVVKVTFKYDSFSRINYVTIRDTKKGWKIASVSSIFE